MAKAMYILILVWVGFCALLESGAKSTVMRYEIVEGRWQQRWKKGWALLAWLPLIIWAGYRGWIGDTVAYYTGYMQMPSSISQIPLYVSTVSKDVLFYAFSALLRCIIGDNFHIYLLILAFIQVYLIQKVYRKYSCKFATCFFLFIASGDYLSFVFNGMRQFTAVTLTFACAGMLLEKKYIKAIIIIIFASLFHQSALIVIPFAFIAQGEAWNKKTLAFLMGVLLAVAFVGRFTSLMDSVLQDTQYSNVISDIMVGDFKDDDGTNPLRVIVYSIPAIIAFAEKKRIKSANSKLINFCTNMSIVSMGLYLISMVTSGIMLGRLPIYFSLYGYILLTWEIEKLFTKKTARTLTFLMVIAYIGFYFYTIHVQYALI